MNSLVTLYTTVALMALVAVACTALCLAWSIPTWRRRLASPAVMSQARLPEIGVLTGWTARVGSSLVSTGIAVCAVIAWAGTYRMLAALIAASW